MRMERIIIGMDFSATAIAAAKWVAEHLAPDAELTLLHVIDSGIVAEDAGARALGIARLHELATFLTAARVRTEVRAGWPHEEIAAAADDLGADLIVVGPHGAGRRAWQPLGTTAERLVRTAGVPVLVAAGELAAQPRRILVGVDDADITAAVLACARDLAEAFDADVLALHVLSVADMSHVLSVAAATAHGEREEEARVESALLEERMRWLDALGRAGLPPGRTGTVVTSGRPGEAILAAAREACAELLVLGRHGSGQVLPALLGSTVRTVLHGAPCPVLVVSGG
jgi:nucleotide-binding universal stress UspA family protein